MPPRLLLLASRRGAALDLLLALFARVARRPRPRRRRLLATLVVVVRVVVERWLGLSQGAQPGGAVNGTEGEKRWKEKRTSMRRGGDEQETPRIKRESRHKGIQKLYKKYKVSPYRMKQKSMALLMLTEINNLKVDVWNV